MTAASVSSLLVSQELFDETILENEECFDLSPTEALRETIDQFRRQLGDTKTPPGEKNNDDNNNNNNGLPACLDHLIISHPNSIIGKRERSDRRKFQERMSFLDGCIDTNGKITAVTAHTCDEVVQAMNEIGRRCRHIGDTTRIEHTAGRVLDSTIDGDTNNGSGTDDVVRNGVDDVNDDSSSIGGPYPNLTIFQKTSSIYTLMSFLGIIDVNSSMLVDEYTNNNNNTNTNLEYKLHVLSSTVNTLSAILATNTNEDDDKCTTIRAELRDTFVPALNRLVSLVYWSVTRLTFSGDENDDDKLQYSNNNTMDTLQTALLCDLLRLGIHATRGCESAKVGWVRSKVENVRHHGSGTTKCGGAHVLVTCLTIFNNSTTILTNNAHRHQSALTTTIETCRLLASLCRYDDFRNNSVGPGPNTSSAHDHALEFHRAGATSLLIGIAKQSTTSTTTTSTATDLSGATASLTALRVMAVNDEIIQTMVAMGILPIVATALRLGVSADGGGGSRSQGLTASSLGLLRNLCGNDEIKTNLCLGSSTTTNNTTTTMNNTTTNNDQSTKSAIPSVLPHVIHAMQIFPTTALVQDHACGIFAAMSLRRPTNARAILDMDGPKYVVTAMKGHGMNVNVQRQGSLAIRNIVSRLLRDLPEEEGGECAASASASDNTTISIGNGMRSSIRDTFLELGAEDVLRNIAGRHQGSVDEAYAALRDLGCTVSLVKYNADEDGVTTRTTGTMMFGEKHNSNFRAVYEESDGLNDGVYDAMTQYGS
jgi:hypothetical protein